MRSQRNSARAAMKSARVQRDTAAERASRTKVRDSAFAEACARFQAGEMTAEEFEAFLNGRMRS